ncbi:MAG: Uma2 family endonuclease [Myxococcota bacterium]
MSGAAYLEWERQQSARHEFHHGEVFAIAGGSPRHNLLSVAAGAELRSILRGRGCHVLSSDQRICAEHGERYVYADVIAVCGRIEIEPDAADVIVNPSVVVEVLPPSTEAYDRGAKWEAYQRLPSLTDYLLISQARSRIEHYRREPDGSWRYRVAMEGDAVVLANDARLLVDAVYEGAFEVELG